MREAAGPCSLPFGRYEMIVFHPRKGALVPRKEYKVKGNCK